ncbi:histone-fold-containing protein [Massarina eburnea CBS 473.64]|uniref:Histone-fold-containing protein n=1 Tax=Massarina eburnea CBS 473.64 TaxID=1395130 RepID=A0A6A6SC52_9PLEO|nr:histone-fold-containing protein [Massarina eburnea CBS 473.64]
MPYNNTPIAPPKDINGQVSLPLARVQKIINADPERLHTSKNAAFAIALATEMFIQHLATTTHNVVKAERKPRRNIQYRDVASAIAKTDNLEFLTDVVPKTITMKEFKKREDEKKKAKEVADQGKAKKNGEAVKEGGGLKNGDVRDAFKGAEKTNGHAEDDEEEGGVVIPASPTPVEEPEAETEAEAMEVDEADDTEAAAEKARDDTPEEDGAAMQIEMEMRGPGPKTNGSPEIPRRATGGFTAINGSK